MTTDNRLRSLTVAKLCHPATRRRQAPPRTHNCNDLRLDVPPPDAGRDGQRRLLCRRRTDCTAPLRLILRHFQTRRLRCQDTRFAGLNGGFPQQHLEPLAVAAGR